MNEAPNVNESEPNSFGEIAEASDSICQESSREKLVAHLWLLWNRRKFVLRVAGIGLALSTLIAFVIPKRFQSTARLMPPDQVDLSTELLTAATAKAGAGLGTAASNLLGLKSTGDSFCRHLAEPHRGR